LIHRENAAPCRFAFVCASYSCLAGEKFAAAGVPHLVCFQELKESTARAFTKHFYTSLVKGKTIKEALKMGERVY